MTPQQQAANTLEAIVCEIPGRATRREARLRRALLAAASALRSGTDPHRAIAQTYGDVTGPS